MTTTPALGADKATDEQIDLRALFEKLTAAKYKPQVARGLHLKNPDGSFQVSSIEMEFRAWQDGYRTAVAAVPASEPVVGYLRRRVKVWLQEGIDHFEEREGPWEFLPKKWAENEMEDLRLGCGYLPGELEFRPLVDAAPAAAPAPVSGMPDLAKPTNTEVYAEMHRREPNWNAYQASRGQAVELALRVVRDLAAIPAPQAPDTPNPTGETK